MTKYPVRFATSDECRQCSSWEPQPSDCDECCTCREHCTCAPITLVEVGVFTLLLPVVAVLLPPVLLALWVKEKMTRVD